MDAFDGAGVSATALAAAAGRAVEASRVDALVVDSYSATLVRAARSPLELPTSWPQDPTNAPPAQQPLLLASVYVGVRTRFIDDFLLAAPQPSQVVVLGSGLDTGSYRLRWPGGPVSWNWTTPRFLPSRVRVLTGLDVQPACEVVSVAVDLSSPWRTALSAAGFDAQEPTAWVLEGVLPYLAAQAQQAILETVVERSSPGSRAAVERAPAPQDTDEVETKLREFSSRTGLAMADLLARATPPDPAALLREAVWRVADHSVRDLCARYGRRLSLTGDATRSRQGMRAPAIRRTPHRHRPAGIVTACR